MKLNGQNIEWSREESNSLCQCGHIKLAHVHFNGGLNLPDGTPTYCGYEDCQCGEWRDRTYQTTEGEKESLAVKTVEPILRDCRIAEAMSDGAKKNLDTLQTVLSSIQTRAKLLQTEANLTGRTT